MSVIALIPARYASARFPGKPLATIAGKPMIQHVYERAVAARLVERVIVATDDERIAACVRGFGGQAVMTSTDHPSGTDRVAEAARGFPDAEIVLNVQGDEPMIDPVMLDALVESLKTGAADCATPVRRIASSEELFDPNSVKVVMRADRTAIYFSRSPIPHVRGVEPSDWIAEQVFYRHIGVYACRADSLQRYVQSEVSAAERCEQLEQLRMLDIGMTIRCVPSGYAGVAVDIPGDIARAEAAIAARHSAG